MKRTVADIVDQQVKVGVDVVSDGEASKIGYSTYVKDRYTGFGGEYQVRPHLDVKDFPEFRKRMAAFLGPPTYRRETCVGPIALKDDAPLKADLANFKAATAGQENRRRFHDGGVAGHCRVVPAEQVLPDPRSLYRSARRGDEVGI